MTFFLIVLLMAASGCAALIYEIVWFQLLQLVIGSAAVSLGLLLAAYMGGLCVGSVILPRIVTIRQNPLRVYGFLELGIGLLGIAVLFGVPLIGSIYVAGAASGVLGFVLRGLVAGICLLPPTILMGATLPAIARWTGSSRLGFLYSSNIAGAVLGCLIAGFYLLRVHDMAIATYVAAALNIVVAAACFVLAAFTTYTPPAETVVETHTPRSQRAAGVYVVIALSGLCALGAQVVWTRLLSLLLGGTVYTFSIILAVFLLGLWIGSGVGSYFAPGLKDPRFALAASQILIAAGIAYTGYVLARWLPFWPVDPWLSSSAWFNFQLDLIRCICAILPATLLWGASFPLALEAVTRSTQDPGHSSGAIYAANTAGAIVGALAFSIILIPRLGTLGSQQLLIGLSAAAAVVAAARASGVLAIAAVVIALGLSFLPAEVPWQVIAYGRRIAPMARAAELYPEQAKGTKVLYRGEGMNASLLILEKAGGRDFYVSGKAEASTAPVDMRLQRMMGHVPALIHPEPRSVLIVGFGAGVTAGSFSVYPEAESIVICEIEPLIPPASTEFFGKENYGVLHDRRTRMIYDDARHYISTAAETFDVITTDPIHPWVKGASTLYSKQYYELIKRHLKPGGVVAQWLPIYDSDIETVKTELATFFEVFPDATVWSNNTNNGGYDLVLIGQASATVINTDELQRRLDRPDYAGVVASLGAVGFNSAMDLLATYTGRASDLRPFLANAQVNEDLNLRLQYLAGFGLNSMSYPAIYRDILAYRRFPDGLFVGSSEPIDALRSTFTTK